MQHAIYVHDDNWDVKKEREERRQGNKQQGKARQHKTPEAVSMYIHIISSTHLLHEVSDLLVRDL